jgi:putative hydrolase of the HAD superfamily
MVPARKLGLKTAYASYGDWRPPEEMDLCFDFRLNTFADLLEYIETLNGFHSKYGSQKFKLRE